jgi:gag-polyprotein putative aspartyl protease
LIQFDGRIGTQRNLKFILDTGATISIVDQKIAYKLKLGHHPAESFNFDRRLNWESAIVPEIQFGPIRAAHVVMFVGKLAECSDLAKNADAVIGLDPLKLSNFSIELATKKIIFTETTPKGHQSAVDRLSDCLILEVRVEGYPV